MSGWTNWSAPHCGVQHRELCTDAGTLFQATATQRDGFAEAYILNLKSVHPFTPIIERDFETMEQAREWLDRQIGRMGP